MMTGILWPRPIALVSYYGYGDVDGLWTKEVTGYDPITERNKLDPYCPVRNITLQYPPIIMLHGTEDTDVPCQESRDIAEQLKRHGVRHEAVCHFQYKPPFLNENIGS